MDLATDFCWIPVQRTRSAITVEELTAPWHRRPRMQDAVRLETASPPCWMGGPYRLRHVFSLPVRWRAAQALLQETPPV